MAFGEDAEISRFAAPDSEKSSQVDVITKWTVDVQIYVVGYWSSADLVEAEPIVRGLDDLIGPISISMVQDVQAGNFFVFLVPRQDFGSYLPVRNTSTLGGAGQLYGLDEAEWAVIVVDSDFPDDIRRDTLGEEIPQMFGLPHDSRRYPDNVFYQGKSDIRGFSEFDKAIIRLLYEPEIENRMTLEVLEKLGL